MFHIDPSRSGDVVDKLLGHEFSGVVGSDRYSAYKRIPVEQRALCYAHLKRNFQSLVDRGGEAARVGRWGLWGDWASVLVCGIATVMEKRAGKKYPMG